MFLRKCRSIEDFTLNEVPLDEKVLHLLMKIDISILRLESTPINTSLSSFLKLLHQSPDNRVYVELPCEYVTDKTLKLMNGIGITCLTTSNNHADVTDEFLLEHDSHFKLNGFKTDFTIQGISDFYWRTRHKKGVTLFGILASDRLEEAIYFYETEAMEDCNMSLNSKNGQKTMDLSLLFDIEDSFKEYAYSIDLNMDDSSEMVPVPHDVFGPVTQQVFQKFEQIQNDPYKQFQPDAYRMYYLTFNFSHWHAGMFEIEYLVNHDRWESFRLQKTNLKADDLAIIIAGILKNCVFIERLVFINIVFDETFYQLLNPFAENIVVKTPMTVDIRLKAESFDELLSAEKGLFWNHPYST